MRELNLDLPVSREPAYKRVAAALRFAIQQGQLRSGDLLPSTRAIAIPLRLHRHTVMAAMEELVAEGWLVPRQRRGYQVAEPIPSTYFKPSEAASKVGPHPRVTLRPARHVDLFASTTDDAASCRFRFLSGMPDLRLFPRKEFQATLTDTLSRSSLKVLDYTDPAGYPPLIAEIETYLRRLRGIHDRAILVTHGSQEGIFLSAQLFVHEGNAVAVEGMGYPPAWAALKAAGGKLIPIALDGEGMVPDALEKATRDHDIKLIYLTPLHQYPTTVTSPSSRRAHIYAIAARAGIPILEDDYDHEFHYRSQPLAPMAASDPAGIVLYVSTFSKVLFPAARIGFLAIPHSLSIPFRHFRRVMTRQNDCLVQDALARWMRTEGFERHLRRMRRRYQERRDSILECVSKMQQQGLPLAVESPDGGMAIWLDTGSDSDRIAEAASKAGVYVTPESRYRLVRGSGRHLRLGFANQSPEEIREGMACLGNIIEHTLRVEKRSSEGPAKLFGDPALS